MFQAAGRYIGPTDGTFWMPPQASAGARETDWLWVLILYIAVFFFALIAALMVLFVIKYRRGRTGKPEDSPAHNLILEMTWTSIPLAILMVIFYFGFHGFINVMTPPDDAYQINVTGQKWAWLFSYPSGYVDKDLHVPVDTPVALTLTSEDVIHSLFVPAFRIKRDAVPGRYTQAWFMADRVGKFDVFCAEYCGEGHSRMHAFVIVHTKADYLKWLAEASAFVDRLPPVEAGKKVFETQGCMQCHSIDGKNGIGPSLKNIYGERQTLQGGSPAVADADYIRESVMDPQAKIVAGYQPVMPTYKGRLADKEITVLIAYLKSLSDKGRKERDAKPAADKKPSDKNDQTTQPAPDAGKEGTGP